ncbi:MAG: response regulator [Nitrospirales bacterium]|nr:response regulator [Nitrospirales bacterium]
MERSNTTRILLVDDGRQLRNVLRIALKGGGYDCVEAQDGWEARDMLTTGQMVDLIITDHQMPRMTGLELVKWVRSQSTISGTPVILYSGQMADDLNLQAEQAGSTAVLTKPFLLQDLLTIIPHLLSPSRGSS